MGNYKIGLALGGGAARGLAHIGVIEELVTAGIKPDFIAGTSMGAFVGGAYAAGKLDDIGVWAETLNMRRFMSLLDVGLTRGGVIDGQRVTDWLIELGFEQPIELLPVSYAAVATDLADGSEVWIKTGSLAAAIRASISVPGILRPVMLDDRWLVDGGLVNQVPISTCRALGADFVIAVNVTERVLGARPQKLSADAAKDAEEKRKEKMAQILDQMPTVVRGAAENIVSSLFRSEPESPGYFDVLANSLDIMQVRITQLNQTNDPPDVSIVPDVASIKLLDFDCAEEAVSAGRDAAKKAVSTIREMISQ
jgi:NTE family protein